MYRISITGTEKKNPYEELIRVFLQPSQYRMAEDGERLDGQDPFLEYRFEGDADLLKRQIYEDLSRLTGKRPKWGILTGIRPVKLAGELTDGGKRTEEILRNRYLLDQDKIRLVTETLAYQRKHAGLPDRNSLSVYIGIPFCPTRCLYCSFTSNQVEDSEIDRYLQALHREIRYAGQAAAEDGFQIESVYIGGGTPTTLTAAQMDELLDCVSESFSLDRCREYTVEAGRPDTITKKKLKVLSDHGVGRISINPQTMRQETLDLIGRRHTVEDTERAFAMAKEAGGFLINTDLIAGLPGEDFPAFAESLRKVMSFGPDNITLHTLAVKRASRLKEMDADYHYRNELLREEMLSHAAGRLREAGYSPYYLYRQKHTSGNTENIGYCRDAKVSIYNIRIMEERQSILALGAGGISKIYFPDENRLERVANVSNYEIYIDRVDDMIDRKRTKFFGQNR